MSEDNLYAPPKEYDKAKIYYEDFVKNFYQVNKNFVQVYNIRTELIKRRLKVIKIIPDIHAGINNDQKRELEYCNRNEQRLLKILLNNEDKILKTFRDLDLNNDKTIETKKRSFSVFKKLRISGDLKALKDLSKAYKKIVEDFYEHKNEIKTRLGLENNIIKNFDKEQYIIYLKLLEDEISRYNILEDEFNKIKKKNKKFLILSGIGTLSAASNVLIVYPPEEIYRITYKISQEVSLVSNNYIAVGRIIGIVFAGVLWATTLLLAYTMKERETLKHIIKDIKFLYR